MKITKALHWFRQDLRLTDNPALYEASKHDEVLPIYILDDFNSGEHSMGDASRFWLHHSLNDLSNNLNQNLSLYLIVIMGKHWVPYLYQILIYIKKHMKN